VKGDLYGSAAGVFGGWGGVEICKEREIREEQDLKIGGGGRDTHLLDFRTILCAPEHVQVLRKIFG